MPRRHGFWRRALQPDLPRATTELTCQGTTLARVALCYVSTAPSALASCFGSILAIVSPKDLYVKFLQKKDQNAKILRVWVCGVVVEEALRESGGRGFES
jgi:hypothetical protein